jgi:ankyrin repeat protein
MTALEGKLLDAMMAADRKAFNGVLRRGAGVNTATSQGVTPLHIAAREGWLPEVKWLLRRGADAGARTRYQFIKRSKRSVQWSQAKRHRPARGRGETPFDWAAMRVNNETIIDSLLPHTPDDAVLQVKGWPPWHLALVRGDDDAAIRILSEEDDVEREHYYHDRPIQVAARHGRMTVVEYLLSRGVKLHHHDEEYSVLHEAARYGHYETVSLLLARGAHVNISECDGTTPLKEAAEYGHCRVARLLLKKGAWVDPSAWGEYPIHSAAQHDHVPLLRLLLKYGAQVDDANFAGETPLHIAARSGALRVMRVLIEHDADTNSRAEYNITPLHSAAGEGEAAAALLLLKQGATVSAHDKFGYTALLEAARAPVPDRWVTQWERGQRGGLCPPPPEYYLDKSIVPPPRTDRRYYARYVETVRLLLEHGASPNVRERETKLTPLHYAALRGDANIARLLIEHGAHLNPIDSDGQSPLAIAHCCDHEQVVKVLLQHGAKNIGGRLCCLYFPPATIKDPRREVRKQ